MTAVRCFTARLLTQAFGRIAEGRGGAVRPGNNDCCSQSLTLSYAQYSIEMQRSSTEDDTELVLMRTAKS